MRFASRKWNYVIGGISALLLAGLITASLAFLYIRNHTFRLILTQAEIQQYLDNHFPISKKHLHLFTVEYSHPRVAIDAESARIRIGADAASRFTVNEKRIAGSAEISGTLRYATQTSSFFLTRFKLESLELDPIPQKYREKFVKAASYFLEEHFETHPIYILRPDTIPKTTVRLLLKGVEVKGGALVVTLGP
jgi:hypothetical protein